MTDDDSIQKNTPAFIIGQSLSLLSVEEIDQTILTLEEEIARLKQERKNKETSRTAAEAFFRN